MTSRNFLLGTACLALLPAMALAQDAAECKGKVPTLSVIGQGMPSVTWTLASRSTRLQLQ